MLAVQRNEDDYVIAYAEYRIVNQDGTPNEKGEYCYVRECWIHPKYKGQGILEDIIKTEHAKHKQVKWLYYKRRKYGGKIKMYRIEGFYE